MDPIRIQIEVVPAEEVSHLQLRNSRLQANYEELSRQMDGLRMMYGELLQCYKRILKELRD